MRREGLEAVDNARLPEPAIVVHPAIATKPRAALAAAAGRAPRVDAHRFLADLDAVVEQSVDD